MTSKSLNSLQETKLSSSKEYCEGFVYSKPFRLEWHSTDSHQAFIKNQFRNKDKLKDFKKNPVTYNINEYGFRTSFDFDNKDSLIALGCSHTFGVGNRENEIWPTILSDRLKLKLYNLGVPGGAMSSCFRVLEQWIARIKPKMVVILEPHPSRREFTNNGEITRYLPTDPIYPKIRKFFDDDDDVNTTILARNAIENLCSKYNAKFYYFEHGSELVQGKGLLDSGRDLKHFGPKTHLALARKMETIIKQ